MPTFYQRFQESARKFPGTIALEIQRQQTVERVTFAELTRMSESMANWLSTRSSKRRAGSDSGGESPPLGGGLSGDYRRRQNRCSTRHRLPRRPGQKVTDR